MLGNQRTDWWSELPKFKWEGCGRIWNLWIPDYQLNHRFVFSLITGTSQTCPTCKSWTFGAGSRCKIHARAVPHLWQWDSVDAGLMNTLKPQLWDGVFKGTTRVLGCHCLDSSKEAIPSAQCCPALEKWDSLQRHSHSLLLDYPSPHFPSPEALSPVWLVCRS